MSLHRCFRPHLTDIPARKDHIAFSPSFVVNLLTHSAMSRPDFAVEQMINYQTKRTGQLTNCGGDILGKATSS